MAQLTGELMVADLKSIANESGSTDNMKPF